MNLEKQFLGWWGRSDKAKHWMEHPAYNSVTSIIGRLCLEYFVHLITENVHYTTFSNAIPIFQVGCTLYSFSRTVSSPSPCSSTLATSWPTRASTSSSISSSSPGLRGEGLSKRSWRPRRYTEIREAIFSQSAQT